MISVILLAAGSGKRMGMDTPKQYLPLGNKRVIDYSLDWAKSFDEVIVVAEKKYHSLFPFLIVTEGGERRQDSVYKGLLLATKEYILVHDTARPFTRMDDIKKLIEEGKKAGAATLAWPIPYTLKEADSHANVIKTIDRSKLWEIQTPQFIRRDLLLKGYEKVHRDQLDVTDDVSIVETIGAPVKLVTGSPFNFKISTMDDYKMAEALACTFIS